METNEPGMDGQKTDDESIRKSEELFAHTPVRRLFLRAAIPGAMGMLISSVYELADAILVGNFLGETAFAAINLAIPFVIVGFALGDLIGSGSAVPISISLGKGDYDHANDVFSYACVLNVATGAIMGLALFFGAPVIMALMGASGELAALATTYLQVYAVFLPLTTIMYSVDNFMRISGHIRRSFLVNAFMAIFGTVLEIVLLGVFHLGVWAAALAYSLAMVVSIVIAFRPFIQGRMTLRFVRPTISFETTREIASFGMPVFLENAAGRIFSILMNMALLRLGGETAVSVYGIIMSVQAVITMLIYGTVDALQPAVGYNWGAHDLFRVKAIEIHCFAASAALGILGFALTRLFPEQMVLVFLPNAGADFLALATHALGLYAFSFLVKWFSFAAQTFMIAVGQIKLASFVSVAMVLIFPVAVLFALWPLGLDGLWLNSPATHVLCAIASALVLLRFRKTVHERVERA